MCIDCTLAEAHAQVVLPWAVAPPQEDRKYSMRYKCLLAAADEWGGTDVGTAGGAGNVPRARCAPPARLALLVSPSSCLHLACALGSSSSCAWPRQRPAALRSGCALARVWCSWFVPGSGRAVARAQLAPEHSPRAVFIRMCSTTGRLSRPMP